MSFFKRKNKNLMQQKPTVKVDSYFHVLHNTKKGSTQSFKVHKSLPYVVFSIVVLALISVAVITKYCFYLTNSISQLEKINDANKNLKGEVEALSLKIKSIQITMNQVESLSTKIKKASTRVDDRANPNDNTTLDSSSGDLLGIGPVSKEDYELSKQLTGIKQNTLQLRNLFDEVDASEAQSSKKLVDFKKLMNELRSYNLKLHLIPDLAPARGRLSSTYGWRMSPFSGKERMHLGLDIAAPIGSPIYATADGVVVRTEVTEDYGRMVEIQHNNKLLTRYGHTSMVYVKEGQKVKKGEVIAAVGSTGRSTGPHVHYEIEVDGKRVDPENYIVLW